MNKAPGVKWYWGGMLGLAQTSSSLVLLKTVKLGRGKNLPRAMDPGLSCRDFPLYHSASSRGPGPVSGGWEQHVPFHLAW